MSQAPRPPSDLARKFDLLAGDFRAHFLVPVEGSWLAADYPAFVDICRQSAAVFESARSELLDWQRHIGQPVTADRNPQKIAADHARWQRNPHHAKRPRALKYGPGWQWSSCLWAFAAFAPPELRKEPARPGKGPEDGIAAADALAAFKRFFDACEDVNRAEFDNDEPAPPPAPAAAFCAFAAMEYSHRAACVALDVAKVPSTAHQPATLAATIHRAAEMLARARVALAHVKTEQARALANELWKSFSPQATRKVERSLAAGDRLRSAVFEALTAYLDGQPLKESKSAALERIAALASLALGRGEDRELDARAVRRTLDEPAANWPGDRAGKWADLIKQWHTLYPPRKKSKS